MVKFSVSNKNRKGETMKRLLSFALALLILFSSINVYALADTDHYLDTIDKKAEAAYENDKVKNLILQGKGEIKDDDRKAFIVELDPSYFSDLGAMVPAKDLYTDQGLKAQTDFGHRANAKA